MCNAWVDPLLWRPVMAEVLLAKHRQPQQKIVEVQCEERVDCAILCWYYYSMVANAVQIRSCKCTGHGRKIYPPYRQANSALHVMMGTRAGSRIFLMKRSLTANGNEFGDLQGTNLSGFVAGACLFVILMAEIRLLNRWYLVHPIICRGFAVLQLLSRISGINRITASSDLFDDSAPH